MKTETIFLWVALVMPIALHAQTPSPSPTPPLPPLIKPVADKVQWAITYKLQPTGAGPGGAIEQSGTSPQSGKKDAAPPTVKFVIKNSELTLERILNENGVKIDSWHLRGGLAVTAVNGKDWILVPSTQAGFDSADYSRQDFAGFDWISPQNFSGVKSVNGRPCLVFTGKVVTLEPSELKAIQSDMSRDFSWMELDEKGEAKPITPEMKARQRVFNIENYKSPVVAYIDDETRMPVALIYKTPSGTITRTYQFQPAPAPLQLPPEAQAVLKGNVERQQRLSVSRAPI